MSSSPIIVWFRRDLRVADNPALFEAAKTGRPLICLYIFETDRVRPLGGASLWWLHHSLSALAKDLSKIGAKLILRKGAAGETLNDIIDASGARALYWNRRYDKPARDRDASIKAQLSEAGLEVKSYRANLLSKPWTVKTKTDNYYKVFTPYWRAAQDRLDTSDPIAAPKSVKTFEGDIKSEALEDWNLLPSAPDWAAKMAPHWTIGSAGAAKALADFVDGPVSDYSEARNRPDLSLIHI